MEFVWKDDPAVGYYEGILLENEKQIDRICFWDYTCPFRMAQARENHYRDRYAYEVHWCNYGRSMSHGFDPDEEHQGFGGYQGHCTHTVDDIKRWCENWIAQYYLNAYHEALKSLPTQEARAKWFESQGYAYEKSEEEK